eukprot:291998-Pyramimonas_sp.AAC.1
MWRHNMLHIGDDQVVTALKADLADTSQTIFERLFSKVSQDPWIVHWTTFDRMATCRFDCAPPKLDQIPVGSTQTHRGRLDVPPELLKRERSWVPLLAQPFGGRQSTETL